jgi:hypothetical protein
VIVRKKIIALVMCMANSVAPLFAGEQNPQSTQAADRANSADQANPVDHQNPADHANPSDQSKASDHANPADPTDHANSADGTNPNASQPTNQSIKPIKLQAEEVDYWIDPDRPHIADSSVNVPKGLWLQENGFQQTFLNRKAGAFDFPESLIRLGVARRMELRYNTPNFLAASGRTDGLLGSSLINRSATFQNMEAGFKSGLGPLGPTHFELAINPYINIPTGFSGQSSRVDPNIKFPFSQKLTDKWDIEGMESFFDPTVNGHRNLDWQNSLVLNRSWGRQRNVFIEYVGDVFQKGPMSNLIHFGGAYRPNRRTQIDTQFGFRMNNAAPIAFFGFGYSFLLGTLNTPELTPSRFNKPGLRRP